MHPCKKKISNKEVIKGDANNRNLIFNYKKLPKKTKKKRGIVFKQNLTKWDNFVLDSLKESDKPMLANDIIAKGIIMKRAKNNKMTDEKIKEKVQKVIQNLIHKKGLVESKQTAQGYNYQLTSEA